MAFKIPVRCGETTTTTGTGTVTTNGAPLQMQTFNAGVGTGNTCPYMIVSGDNVNWERGLGTVTVSAGVTTVARTTVVESSNSNSAISLVGTSFIFVALPGDVANTNGLLDLVFGSSNGTYNLVRSGGVWTTAAAGSGAAGSGLFSPVLSALPTASSTGLSTWQTQNGASVADAATGITITGASASNSNWNLRTKAAPGTPYTITALLAENYAASAVASGIIGMAIGWTDGTKLHVVQYQNGNLLVSRYTNSTTFSANDFSSGQTYAQLPMAPMWFRIKDDGTNVFFYWSTDGANFQQLYTVAKASGFLGGSGYSNVLFGANSNGAICMATLMSWTQA
jgi:hypothetical protein